MPLKQALTMNNISKLVTLPRENKYRLSGDLFINSQIDLYPHNNSNFCSRKLGCSPNRVQHILNAVIDTVVYVGVPAGFKTGNNFLLKLHKSFYRLEQSGKNWNNMLHKFLVNQHFVQSLNDFCVQVRSNQSSSKDIIIAWVDDLIISASNSEILNEMKSTFNLSFKMKDIGSLSYFLGINFEFSASTIRVYQTTLFGTYS